MPARRKSDVALQDRSPVRQARRVVSLPPVDPAAAIPPAPRGLLKSSRQRWDAFWRSPLAGAVDRQSDLGGLQRWILSFDEWQRAMSTLRRGPRMTLGSTRQSVMSPLVGYLAQREAELARLEEAYGMTPRARLHLGLVYGQTQLTAARLKEMLDDGHAGGDDSARDEEYDPA